MSGPHLHSVGFHVADLNATTSFYRLLGLDVPAADQGPVVATSVTGPATADLTLTWATTAALQPLDPDRVTDPTLRVQVEIGFEEPADVDAAWKSAVAAGHRGVVEPFNTPWGVRFAVLTDPDGNRVACTAALLPETAEERS